MWKEAVVENFEVLYRNFPEGLRETAKNINQDILSPNQDLKPRPPQYEAAVLPHQPRLLTLEINNTCSSISPS
jgi:hypothetical protein